jgi:transposase-like protein
MRVFSTAFKEAAVVRLAAGERLAAVARELGIARKLLYEWRAAHRRFGVAGLNRRRGPKPRSARASPDAAPATPAALSELARAQARIAELERKIGRQAIDLDFFREALRLIDARDPSSRATPSTRSSKR